MPATVSIRRSLEPLAAALIAIGLVHLLVGFIVLNILPEIHKQTISKASIKLLWYAPSDFLLNKKVEVETPVVVQSSDLEKAPAPTVSPTAMPAEPKSVQAEPQPPVPPPAPPVAISPPSKPAEKSLAEVLQTNRGLMPQAPDAGFMALTPMPLTINSVEPSAVSPPNIAPPAPPAMTPPAPPVMPVAPPTPAPTPAVTGSPPVTAPSAPTILGDQKEANKYITLSAILPPGKAPAKPRENKPVLNLLDVANLNANERAEDVEAGG
ncbi:MAG: hypothetical protein NTV80_25860, partial [Verrucomicrobia bacterium]|nr:hypothetical protein [Verrucomicrobiota bacterium]